MSAASNAVTNTGYAPAGFSRARVTSSLIIAVVLHICVLGAYFFLGSSKKPAPAVAVAKPATESTGTADLKPKTEVADSKKPMGKPDTTTEKKIDPKLTEVAKPGEIPKQPDSGLDDLFKK